MSTLSRIESFQNNPFDLNSKSSHEELRLFTRILTPKYWMFQPAHHQQWY